MRHPDVDRSGQLVQMSVHALPVPEQVGQVDARMGRWQLWLVLLVCAAPVLASYFSYYVWRPDMRSNYGSLITPPRPMPPDDALHLQRLQGGEPLSSQALKGQWLLVVVAGSACDHVCERQLYVERQLREMLGRDMDRLDRVWLIPDAGPVRDALRPALSGAWALRVDPAALAGWLQPEAGQPLGAHLYLVDPRGDWMMRFPVDADPVKVKKDLLRLLKASESWDQPGR